MFDLLANVMSAPLLVPTDINIDPNTNGLPGINQLRTIVGAVMTIGLILSVLALIVSAIVWGFGANSSNPHLASRGKIGVLVSCGAAVICGASVTLINFFWNVGQSVWPGRRRELVFVMGVCDVPVISSVCDTTVQAWMGHASIATTNLYLHHLGTSADLAGLGRLNAAGQTGGTRTGMSGEVRGSKSD